MRNSDDADLQELLLEVDADFSSDSSTASTLIPENPSVRVLAFGIALAHFLFGNSKAVVIFVVQPGRLDIIILISLLQELINHHGISGMDI